MGGSGSGRDGWRTTVESALQLDIDTLVRRGVIRLGMHADGVMTFQFRGDELAVEFEVKTIDPKSSWIKLKYVIREHAIEDEFRLITTRPISAACGGCSDAQPLADGCASSFCAGTGFDHEPPMS